MKFYFLLNIILLTLLTIQLMTTFFLVLTWVVNIYIYELYKYMPPNRITLRQITLIIKYMQNEMFKKMIYLNFI